MPARSLPKGLLLSTITPQMVVHLYLADTSFVTFRAKPK
jgi:hypothetical protein